jgi:hypothetical protein
MDIDRWMGLRLAFMQEKDPLTAVRDLVEAQPEYRLYRLGGTPSLMRRQFVWRVLEHFVDGIVADAMPLGSARQDNMLLTGLLEAVPGAVVCAPLTARFQPLAAVLMTSSGAEVAMLSYGSGFVRMPRMDPWPVGVGRPWLTGPGRGIYQVGVSAVRLAGRPPAEVLRDCRCAHDHAALYERFLSAAASDAAVHRYAAA